MPRKISGLSVRDIRTPTSRTLAGSDAVHTDPDYSATYVVLSTDAGDGLEGHGMTFTLGRGNEVCVAAVRALQHLVVGATLESITGDMGAFWQRLTHESQLRWIGPEKGALHLATAAIVNAVWDLYAKAERKPVWKLVADMTPEQIVSCIDFRYITDALTRADALEILRRNFSTRAEREAQMRKEGYPAYITSAGWMGYPDDKVRRLCREALADGWRAFKIKVGRDSDANVHRAALVREEIGPDNIMMMDANQAWDVGEAIEFMRPLAKFNPLWIEEPTSPDDILGHAAIRRAIRPVGVATGEHAANRVMFKQLMQAQAIDFCQFDNCRLGGLNEVLAVLLLAAKFEVPVCPHAGGIGLCEYAQHTSLIDYICVSGKLENRMTEFADHLHEHFKNPVVVRNGRYMPPTAPGFSIEMKPASLDAFEFPGGAEWRK
ncbi:MAG: L-fuconate dehydratase [Candidatus Binatus sp.]|uniref:L-fuconate dehydratase n=1 Tax=Candidatus Binatus sp. TaxID=2811406 RepID=UPI0027230C5F|nr:L-fuconate dehydratase [Candidatus Binatus sp.]MDO8434667.1 L-fuconate dehydratase [Candidatus Binatus sp.]